MASDLQTMEKALRVLPAAGAQEVSRMGALELRMHFLAENLFADGESNLYYAEGDRMVIGGIRAGKPVPLPPQRELGTRFFLERRELGAINLGAAGLIRAGGRDFRLQHLDCLYVGMGCEEIEFASEGEEAAEFYLLSCPAHRAYPTAKIQAADSVAASVGDAAHASCRTIHKYICPETVPTCQLTMGVTTLEANNVWNTWPPHTHGRRSEVYLYFNLGDGTVTHLMGRPEETRHILVRDRQAVYSPAWSVHSGAGTNRYSFVWGMAGENQDFGDVDVVAPDELR
jgi:4-deoxy-L-threo-5-hexosulose-uronate ketol-isomerase